MRPRGSEARSVIAGIYVPAATVLLLIGWISLLVSVARHDRAEAGMSSLPDFHRGAGSDCKCLSPMLVLGNSQTFSIPDARPGDLSTPQWIQLFLSGRSPNTVGVQLGALGGMTAEEMLVRTIQWEAEIGYPKQLLIAIQPSELSQVAIRPELVLALKHPQAQRILEDLVRRNGDLGRATAELDRLAQLPPTPKANWAENVEGSLQEKLSRMIPVLEYREDLASLGDLLFNNERDRVFGIHLLSRKAFKPESYHTSLEFTELLLRHAQESGMPTYVYLAPIRPEEESIYTSSDTSAIASDIRILAKRYGASFADYQRSIPEQYWTVYGDTPRNRLEDIVGKPDPAHFREAAHKMLAEEIDRIWGESMIARADAVAHARPEMKTDESN